MNQEFFQKNVGNHADGFSHHAYFFPGRYDDYSEALVSFLRDEFQFEKTGNPDFHEYLFDRLYIENAGEIKAEESKRVFHEGSKKIFCIAFSSITHEAGNTFLKVLEEPSEDTIFFFFAPSAERLLSTVRSRLLMVEMPESQMTEARKEMKAFCEVFLRESAPQRLQKIEKLVKDKDRREATVFLDTLEEVLYEKIELQKMTEEERRSFEEIEKARDYLRDTASSVKLLLEHISLVLPKEI